MCVPVCPYGQNFSGLGYWGTRESQPALCDGVYQQWSCAEASCAPAREKSRMKPLVWVLCVSVIGVASGVYVWCVHLPAGSRFSALLLVGLGHGAVAVWPHGCRLQRDTSSPNIVVYNYKHWVVSVMTQCFHCL